MRLINEFLFLKRKFKFRKVNPILKTAEVKEYLEDLHSKFVVVPIDKASNNVSVICKKFYIEVILKEIGVTGEGNATYQTSDLTKDDIVQNSISYTKKLKLEPNQKDFILPCMY